MRRLLTVVLLASLTVGGVTRAESEPPVEVTLHEPPPPQRRFVLSWSPLPLLIGKVSFDLVLVPKNHHGIVLCPFYVNTSTAPVYAFNDMGQAMQLAQQSFVGWGGELGYRYYFGKAGPRGLFLGPSLILGWFTATAGNGTQLSYLYYGGAVDVGYQMLVANRVSIGFGGGLQVTGESKAIPTQQFPARFYANFSVLPRLLASLGVAF